MSQRLKEWAMERFPEVFEEEREPTFPPEYEKDTDNLDWWQEWVAAKEGFENEDRG